MTKPIGDCNGNRCERLVFDRAVDRLSDAAREFVGA